MNIQDKEWLKKQVASRWDKLDHAKLDVTDADSIRDEIAQAYGYEREKAEYEYEKFMNDLEGRDARAEHSQENVGNAQNRGPLSERVDEQ